MPSSLLLATLVIGAGTYLIRAGSLSWGGKVAWPEWTRRWLSLVTPAVLGALIGPLLLVQDNHLIPVTANPALLAAVPTAIVGWRTRHLLLTVLVGVVCFAIATQWL